MGKFVNKTVIVTGGNSGIGRAAAIQESPADVASSRALARQSKVGHVCFFRIRMTQIHRSDAGSL